MKANKLFVLSVIAMSLSSCTGGTASSTSETKKESDVQTVINSLKGVSHTAHVNYDIYVNQKDEDSLDGYVGYISDRTFSYSENGEKAYKIIGEYHMSDLQKGTHDFMKDEDGNDIVTVYDNGEKLYFRDQETGVILSEYLNVDNTVSDYIQSDYDYTAGTYIPLIFDDEFRNPFDYIQERDITKVEDHKYSLSLDKAAFALECYGSVAAMAVQGCTITTNDDNQIIAMNFDMATEGGEGYSYTRNTTFDIEYSKFGAESELKHVVPCTNDNPKLAKALASIATADSYSYSKDYLNSNGLVDDHIVAYVTKDAAYYHHHDSPSDTTVYSVGDDYDYMAARCEANGKYYGYEYTYNTYTGTYEPGLIMLSVSAAYSIDDFSGLGPNFAAINPAIFSLKEGTDNVYIIENDVLRTSIGSYFDLQFLGVNSSVLDGRTSQFELTLDDDGSITVKTGYAYAEYGYTRKQKINFKLQASSINNTKLPEYVTIPDTTGDEQW